MNKERRTKIREIKLKLEQIKDELLVVLSDEEFAFDSMPEGLQSSTRGMDNEDAIDSMNEAIENIDDAISKLDDIN